jgi:hypothetical protein
MTTPSPSCRTYSHNAPKQYNSHSKDGAENLEEQTREDVAKLDRRQRHDTERKGKAPPAHVEWKGTRLAKHNHVRPNAHMMSAIKTPLMKKMSPATGMSERKCVAGKTLRLTWPRYVIEYPPMPSGPSGKKDDTTISRGGSLCRARRV